MHFASICIITTATFALEINHMWPEGIEFCQHSCSVASSQASLVDKSNFHRKFIGFCYTRPRQSCIYLSWMNDYRCTRTMNNWVSSCDGIKCTNLILLKVVHIFHGITNNVKNKNYRVIINIFFISSNKNKKIKPSITKMRVQLKWCNKMVFCR